MKKEYLSLFLVLVCLAVLSMLIWYKPLSRASNPIEATMCTMEAKMCPDGSYVGRSGPQCQFAACPTDNWKTSTDPVTGSSLRYPETIPTTYIHTVDWPPKLQLVEGPFTCIQAGQEIDRAGKTESRVINGKDYCVTTLTEGAAGSTYTQYAYATQIGGKVAVLTFTLRQASSCSNYDDPQKSECEAERATFTIDPIIGQIIETIVL